MKNEICITKKLNQIRARSSASTSNQSFKVFMFNAISFTLGVSALSYVLSAGEPTDASELTSLVYILTASFSIALLLFRPLILLTQSRAQPLGAVILQLTVFVLLMHLIKNDGDELIELAKQYPTHSIAIGISLGLSLFIDKLGRNYFYVESRPIVGERYALGISASPMTPSKRDLEIARIHEAGHAMIYAATTSLPSTVRVSVFDSFNATGSLGGVSTKVEKNTFLRENELNFFMYLTLAGLAAEKVHFNEPASGGSSDLAKWKLYANRYLDGGFSSEPYVVDPQSVQDAELNATLLQKLRTDQMANLEHFFLSNHQLLMELADALKERNTLDAEALNPFLKRVALPEWLEPVEFVEDHDKEV
ncbi:TPA: hypothetical protein ACGSTL_001381 [Vibrio parahaemolyticus]